MNTSSEDPNVPLIEPDPDATYSLEVVAQMTGISTQTIIHYREQGLLPASAKSAQVNEEALRTLRRIEHLRASYEMNLAGLKHMLELMDEVERLQLHMRARR